MSRAVVLDLLVHGDPQPAGSKKGFVNKKTGKVIITDDAKKSRPWKQEVAGAAAMKMQGEPFDGAIEMEITFYVSRPKGHYGSGRNSRFVKDSSPAYPATRPDVDKLSRAVLDALKGIAYTDDSRIVAKVALKRYADAPGARIKVFCAAEQVASDLSMEQRVRGGVAADDQADRLFDAA